MAVLWNQDVARMTLRYRKIDAAAATLGVTVQGFGVRAPDDLSLSRWCCGRTR